MYSKCEPSCSGPKRRKTVLWHTFATCPWYFLKTVLDILWELSKNSLIDTAPATSWWCNLSDTGRKDGFLAGKPWKKEKWAYYGSRYENLEIYGNYSCSFCQGSQHLKKGRRILIKRTCYVKRINKSISSNISDYVIKLLS